MDTSGAGVLEYCLPGTPSHPKRFFLGPKSAYVDRH
jgi:hypothetical protein